MADEKNKSGMHPGAADPEGQVKKTIKRVNAARGTPYEQMGGYGEQKRKKAAEEDKLKDSYYKIEGKLIK